MKKAICSMALAAFLAASASAEIAYGESGTFALGSGSGVQQSALAPLAAASLTVSPNPALSNVNLRWNASVGNATVKLSIYNVKGELVRTLSTAAGARQASWNGKNSRGAAMPSGVYIVRLTAGKLTLQKNLVICR